ncbi:MAG TPA: 2-phosphosulfolactate phosphatase [Ktedonobacteraceae bacterium]|nr:2-phosphosulfolactate phosphatase [Ktedonobacteraceae bacterium]
MYLDVFFTPSAIVIEESSANDIYIVVDVIRATTSMAVMFDQGAARVLVAGSIEQAREAAQKIPGRLLCGERNVQRIPGFDYGNSPVQFSRLDLGGRELIMTTTNGTRAFYACPQQALRLAGSFYNAGAVTARALSLANAYACDIHIVCSGENDYFGLDDAVCAGYLALELQRQQTTLQLWESASAAGALYEAYKPPRVLDYCSAARAVIEGGLPEDPPFCMRASVSNNAPLVVGREPETGLLVIERGVSINGHD